MRRYGLIGYPLTHSFSQKYFTEKFEREHIADAVYQHFSLGNISELLILLKDHPDLHGLNVTIPYKKAVLPFLAGVSETVDRTGACNCIKVVNGDLKGFNTDVTGFEKSLIPFLKPHHRKALVLGTGGAAAAVVFVLQKIGIAYQPVSRTKTEGAIDYAMVDEALMASHQLIINTTPLGQHPKVNEYAQIPYQYITAHHHLYDLVYNPAETAFLMQGRLRGATIQNGYEMLVIQAEESWRIWNE